MKILHDKRFWKGLGLVVPLLVLAVVIMYAQSIVQFLEDTVYETRWKEKVMATQRLAHKVDDFVALGYDLAEDRQVFEDSVSTTIQILDLEDGLFAAAFNQDLMLTTNRNVDDTAQDDPLTVPESRERIFQALRSGEPSGYITVPWENKQLELYFQCMPADQPVMYSVIGVSREAAVSNLEIHKLELPLFLVGLILIFAFEALIYIRMKVK